MQPIITFLAIVGLVLSACPGDLRAKFIKFKETYEKKYDSSSEEEKRYGIFVKNLEKIEEHNARYKAGLETYFEGVNQFTDITDDEFDASLQRGFIPAPAEMNDGETFYEQPGARIKLPASVDYRQKNACSAPRDQGLCECSWALSTVGVLESLIFLKTGNLIQLSPQNLIDCSSEFGTKGCLGAWPEQALKYIQANGIATEANYPYTGKEEPCKYDSAKKAAEIQSYVMIRNDSETDLQSAVANIGPISVVVDAKEWHLYQGGIFQAKLPLSQVGHPVIADGYGIENGTEYWLIRNSYGPTWGEKGYIRIKKGNNEAGITHHACYPVIKM